MPTEADKAFKRFLQGSWLGHPLHPALVHIPTGLWPAALLFDVIAFVRPGDNAVVQTAFWCIVGGLAGALLAAPTGLADWWDIKKEKPAKKLGLIHAGMNVGVMVLLIVSLILRADTFQTATTVTAGELLTCLVANAMLGVSGYIGGRMVYEHGVGVARENKEELRKVAVAGNARVPAQ